MDLQHLEVVAISRREWRICDKRIRADDARRVLGFVENNEGSFEVMHIGQGFHWSTCDSLEQAVACFCDARRVEVDPAALRRGATAR